MINVVFLLLIFFLISAQITPPEPFEVTPPESRSDTAAVDPDTLYISASGTIGYVDAIGAAALDALSARTSDAPLNIRADAALKASVLAGLLPELAARGVRETRLIVGSR
jgi:biopolymer transport protein ExbD